LQKKIYKQNQWEGAASLIEWWCYQFDSNCFQKS